MAKNLRIPYKLQASFRKRAINYYSGLFCRKWPVKRTRHPVYLRHHVGGAGSPTDSDWDFGWIWNCTKEFELLDLVDFGGVAFSLESVILGGEDALSCRSFFTKEPLIEGLFCGKWLIKIRYSVGLRHPVRSAGNPTESTPTENTRVTKNNSDTHVVNEINTDTWNSSR